MSYPATRSLRSFRGHIPNLTFPTKRGPIRLGRDLRTSPTLALPRWRPPPRRHGGRQEGKGGLARNESGVDHDVQGESPRHDPGHERSLGLGGLATGPRTGRYWPPSRKPSAPKLRRATTTSSSLRLIVG